MYDRGLGKERQGCAIRLRYYRQNYSCENDDKMVFHKGHTCRQHAGFTLIEVMLALAILAIIAALAIPAYQGYILEGRIGTAVKDIRQAELILNDLADDGQLGSLDANNTAVRGVYLRDSIVVLDDPSTAPAGAQPWLDPWGRIYRYQRPATRTDSSGAVSNNSVNPQGYDLFSDGPDASDTADDVMRACNGGFVGTAGGHSC